MRRRDPHLAERKWSPDTDVGTIQYTSQFKTVASSSLGPCVLWQLSYSFASATPLRRGLVAEAGRSSSDFVEPKTMAAAPGLARRCVHASVGNPANQA